MDKPEVAAFNKTLVSMYEMKVPISKQKIMEITKAAMSAIHYFKHVVLIVEKFICKCKPEYKVPGFYVVDSIMRQGKRQYKNKDVFGPRFAINLRTTLENALNCSADDRLKIVRVLNLWLANGIFDEQVLNPCLQHCRASGIDVNVETVELKVKGKADLSIYNRPESDSTRIHKAPSQSNLPPKTPPENEPSQLAQKNELSEMEVLNLLSQLKMDWGGTFRKNIDLLRRVQCIVNEKIQERIEIDNRRQGNIKNLLSQDFDYSDEEETDTFKRKEPIEYNKDQINAMAQGILQDSAVRDEIQQMYNQSVLSQTPIASGFNVQPMNSQTIQQPRTPPMAIPHFDTSVPPPFIPNASQLGPSGFSNVDRFSNLVPPGIGSSDVASSGLLYKQPPPFFQNSDIAPPGVGLNVPRESDVHRERRKRERSRSRDRSDRDVRSRRESDYERDKNRNRDRSRDRHERDRSDRDRRSERDKSESDRRRKRSESPRKDQSGTEQSRKEKERRRNGLPQTERKNHVLIASRTLWFGKLTTPQMCNEEEIRNAISECGVSDPERINVIPPRACAYVTMSDRRSAFKIIDRMAKDIKINKKNVKISWAIGQGLKNSEQFLDYWDSERGISQIPHNKITLENLEPLLDGSYLDVDTLPPNLKGLFNEKGVIKNPEPSAQNPMSFPTMQLPGNNVTQLTGQPFSFPAMAAIPAAGFIMPHGLIQPAAIFAATPGTPNPPQGFGNMFQTVPATTITQPMSANQNQPSNATEMFGQNFHSSNTNDQQKRPFDIQRGRGGRANGRGFGRGGFDNNRNNSSGFGGGRSRFNDRTEHNDNGRSESQGFGNARGFGFPNNDGPSEGGFGRDRDGNRNRGGRGGGNRGRYGGHYDRDANRDRGRGRYESRNREERHGREDRNFNRQVDYEDRRSTDDPRDQIEQTFETGLENPSRVPLLGTNQMSSQRDKRNSSDQGLHREGPTNSHDYHDDESLHRETESADFQRLGQTGIERNSRFEHRHNDPEDPVSTSAAHDFYERSLPNASKSALPENPEVSSTTFNDDPIVEQQASFVASEYKQGPTTDVEASMPENLGFTDLNNTTE